MAEPRRIFPGGALTVIELQGSIIETIVPARRRVESKWARGASAQADIGLQPMRGPQQTAAILVAGLPVNRLATGWILSFT